MNVSGVLVVVPKDRLDSIRALLGLIDGVDVHHVHASTGRLVATIEAETIDEEAGILRKVQAVDGVILAEMVHHHFEDNPVVTPDSNQIPSLLRDDVPLSLEPAPAKAGVPYSPKNNRKNRRSLS